MISTTKESTRCFRNHTNSNWNYRKLFPKAQDVLKNKRCISFRTHVYWFAAQRIVVEFSHPTRGWESTVEGVGSNRKTWRWKYPQLTWGALRILVYLDTGSILQITGKHWEVLGSGVIGLDVYLEQLFWQP